MPRAEILSKQALHTLTQLHAELAGKIETNRHNGDKLRGQMVQVEAVIKMLAPDFSVAAIAAKRRNKSNPWFKRGTLYRSVVDALRGWPFRSRDGPALASQFGRCRSRYFARPAQESQLHHGVHDRPQSELRKLLVQFGGL